MITSDGLTLFVADTVNRAILSIDLTTGVVSTIAGSISGIVGHVDAIGLNARFGVINGMILTQDDSSLVITDILSSFATRTVILKANNPVPLSSIKKCPCDIGWNTDSTGNCTQCSPGQYKSRDILQVEIRGSFCYTIGKAFTNRTDK